MMQSHVLVDRSEAYPTGSRRLHEDLSVDWQPPHCCVEHSIALPPVRDWQILVNRERGSIECSTQQCGGDRKSTRLNSSHTVISYAVFCLKKKKTTTETHSDCDHRCRLMLPKT